MKVGINLWGDTMNNDFDIIDYIEKLRIKKGMTIKDLTENIVAQRSYTRYLSKESTLQLNVLDAFLKRLSVPLFQFSLYIKNNIMLDNFEEYYFFDQILNEDYKDAKEKYDSIIKHKTLKSPLAKKSIPIAILIMKYNLNKISKFSMHNKVRQILKLSEFEESNFLLDHDIQCLILFLRVASDSEKTRIANVLYDALFNDEFKIFTSNVELAYTTLYYVLLESLTKRDVLRTKDHEMIEKTFTHYLKYYRRSLMTGFDLDIFKTLYEYYSTKSVDKKSFAFYYLSLLLISSDASTNYLEEATLSTQDKATFLELLKNPEFKETNLFERLISHE